jgi:hypothetical protein
MINLFKDKNIKVKIQLIEDKSEKDDCYDIILFPEAVK